VEQRAGLEVEPVGYRELFKEVRTVGKLDYNEGRVAYIAARIAGRVDRIHVDFTGIQVKKGYHLVDIYSPELFLAQGELLRSLEAYEKATGDRSFAQVNLEAARTKLSLLGILPEQIKEIEKSRKTQTHLTIYAPIGGTVIEKNVRLGQYVKEGDMLYRIADLDPIWLFLDIYESDHLWVRQGQAVEVSLEAYPAETFRGVVTFIDPYLDDKTRTVKVRVNLKNPERRLKPAMYASALIRVRLLADGTPEPTGLEGKFICPMHPEVVQDKLGRCPICEMQLERVPETRRQPPKEKEEHKHDGHEHEGHAGKEAGKKASGVLAIRAAAVLDTGRRKVTYRRNADGAFELVELELGPLAEGKDDTGKSVGYYPVLKGLKDGDRVVARGGFLLDSQQQISGMPSLLYKEGQSAATLHSGHGSAPAQPSAPSGHKH
jgi:Cu(I)/Ag(I) efflux system membrane fusion protein